MTALSARRLARWGIGWLPVVVVLCLAAAVLVEWIVALSIVPLGADFDLYLGAARGWLAGGAFYDPRQVAAPFTLTGHDIVFPPPILPLCLPFLVLPPQLWWLIPAAVVVWTISRHHPTVGGWIGILACLAYPEGAWLLVAGNPTMWAVAALALGTVYGWPSVGVLLKPTLAPFALFGARRRSWWMALGIAAAVNLPLLPLWVDWTQVVIHARGGRTGIFYSWIELPLMLVPFLAWRTRQRGRVLLPPAAGPSGATEVVKSPA